MKPRLRSRKSSADAPKASVWVPGGGKTRIRLSNGRSVAEDELSPTARSMLDKFSNIDEQYGPTNRGFHEEVAYSLMEGRLADW